MFISAHTKFPMSPARIHDLKLALRFAAAAALVIGFIFLLRAT